MDREIALRIIDVQEAAMEDEGYLRMLKEYRILDRRLLRALKEMTPQHRDLVMDHLGLVHAMHGRLTEIACAMNKNVEKSR